MLFVDIEPEDCYLLKRQTLNQTITQISQMCIYLIEINNKPIGICFDLVSPLSRC